MQKSSVVSTIIELKKRGNSDDDVTRLDA